jgi:hypothetical protein
MCVLLDGTVQRYGFELLRMRRCYTEGHGVNTRYTSQTQTSVIRDVPAPEGTFHRLDKTLSASILVDVTRHYNRQNAFVSE